MEPPSDDLCKSTEELLAELHELSVSGASPTNPAFNTLLGLRAMRKFACVLTVLGRQADEQTRRIVKLTWGLVLGHFAPSNHCSWADRYNAGGALRESTLMRSATRLPTATPNQSLQLTAGRRESSARFL